MQQVARYRTFVTDTPVEQLQAQVEQLKVRLENRLNTDYVVAIEPSEAQVGSGSQPLARIPSVAVTIFLFHKKSSRG